MTAKVFTALFICGKQSKWYIKRKANNALFVVTMSFLFRSPLKFSNYADY